VTLVPGTEDTQKLQNPEQASNELSRGIERCQTIVDDYRSKLAANLNARRPANSDGDDEADDGAGSVSPNHHEA